MSSQKLSKNGIHIHHIAVGEDTDRGWVPWSVSSPTTFLIQYKILYTKFRQLSLDGLN